MLPSLRERESPNLKVTYASLLVSETFQMGSSKEIAYCVWSLYALPKLLHYVLENVHRQQGLRLSDIITTRIKPLLSTMKRRDCPLYLFMTLVHL